MSRSHGSASARSDEGLWRQRPLGRWAAALTFFVGSSLAAQNHTLDLRLLEVNENGDRTYQNFLYSGAIRETKFSLEVFALFLPQLDDYKEFGVGLGYRAFALGETSVSFVAYLSSAPDDDYFQPALFALDVEGEWTGSLFVLRYLPLGDNGIEQWLVDPAEIQYNLWRSLSLGVSGYFYRPAGGSWLRKIGPKVSLGDKLGATEIAIRDVNQGGGFEVQLRRILVF